MPLFLPVSNQPSLRPRFLTLRHQVIPSHVSSRDVWRQGEVMQHLIGLGGSYRLTLFGRHPSLDFMSLVRVAIYTTKFPSQALEQRIIEETDKHIHIVVQLTGRYNWIHDHQDHRYGALQLLRSVEIDLQKGFAGNFHTREVLF